ncbi:hypothetical protein [Tabrizicola sp. BL-A-41-H6]|uniref:hypothetical protein n=1 Tax=Tabrizicola sp. BL-A-41-H6 TaxID=3421107 RepID=UPI003D66D99C
MTNASKSRAVLEAEKLYDRAIRADASEAISSLSSLETAIAARIGTESKEDKDLLELIRHDFASVRKQIELATTLDGALAQIAAFFYDPVDGYRGTYNALGLQQRVALGNMIGNALYQIDRAEDYRAQEKHKLGVLVAQSDGTEISINNINAALDRVDRIENAQLPILRDWLASLKTMHIAATGEAWVAPVKRGANPQQQTREAMNERLARLGIAPVKTDTPDYEPQTNGTETRVA